MHAFLAVAKLLVSTNYQIVTYLVNWFKSDETQEAADNILCCQQSTVYYQRGTALGLVSV